MTDNRKILNTVSSVKPILGHLFLQTLLGSGSGKEESCSVPAVFIAQCLWETMFSALHRASILPVCCLLLLLCSVAIPTISLLHKYFLNPPVWLTLLVSLLPQHSLSVQTSYSHCFFTDCFPSFFLPFSSCIQAQGIFKTCDDQGGH